MSTGRDYTIHAVQNALRVLKLFKDKPEMILSELSLTAGIGKSSMLRILYTLAQDGFVSYDAETQKYSLGLELYCLGKQKFESLDLRKIAARYLQKLSDKNDMICYLGLRDNDILIMVEKIVPSRVPAWTQLLVQRGETSELYSTGIGRLFLAQDSPDEIERYFKNVKLQKFTEDTIVDKEKLKKLIFEAGEKRYSYNLGENEVHVCSLCAPIYDLSGRMIAGISLCGMQDILFGEEYDSYLEQVTSTAKAISKELGFAVD